MTKRFDWKFPYTADKLFDAASLKKDFHTSRLQYWTKKKEEAETELKEKGINIEESVAKHDAFYAAASSGQFSNTIRRAPTVSLNHSLVNDMNECLSKMDEHHMKIREYDAWIQVLESQGQASFDLNQDDWLFFFGK